MILLALVVVFAKLDTLSSSPCSQLMLLFLTIFFFYVFLFSEFLCYTRIAMCGWRVQGQLFLNSPNLKSGVCSIPLKLLV